MALHTKKCIPCEKGGNGLELAEIQKLMFQLDHWSLESHIKIYKNFHFLDFKRAMSFANEVADLAEYEGHHPDIYIHNWNQLKISLSTHAVKGLTENDFIMAAKIDQLLKESLSE